ncbi:MAG: hypothetical protein KBS95_04935 [Alistipes sp.]|nr:hypothetical protein [Candidatus Alistipes equi]
MSNIRLTTPEGYFERSMERTFATAERIKRRRRGIFYCCLVIVVMMGTFYSIHSASVLEAEKEYLAMQAEIARLDIFMEVN